MDANNNDADDGKVDDKAEADREATGKSWRKTLDLSAVGLAFPIALAIGYGLGSGIGDKFGYPVAGRVIGSVVGALAGFHNLLHMANRK